jgi:chromosome segregation ATPase
VTEVERLEAALATLLAERTALDAKRETLNAEIAAAREALRIERLKRQQAEPAPSSVERSHQRLAQVRQWIEAGESADKIAQRLTVGVERARVVMRQARALAVAGSRRSDPA